jgi:hypothetical protein
MLFDILETVMKSAELYKVWGAPDNSRLTAKQQSFRLPIHVAAKINALCDVYPHRTKTEIVGDLLATVLDDAIRGLCWTDGELIAHDPEQGDIRESVLTAEGSRFIEAANRHFKALERELGNKSAADLYPAPRPMSG